MTKFLRMTKKVANKSSYQFKLGALVVKGGKIISEGHNVIVTDGNVPITSIHAEEMALKKAGKKATGSTLIVARPRKSGGFGMSKPCRSCHEKILNSGIRTVVYTYWDGQLKYYRV